jgi:hypothetical protein
MKLGNDSIMRGSLVIVKAVILGFLLISESEVIAAGSFGVQLDQRFMRDKRFGKATGFSHGFRPELQIVAGLHEFSHRIEPILSLGLLWDSTRVCAVLEDGVTCEPGVPLSQDRISYSIYSFGGGVKWTAWHRDVYFMAPFLQTQMSYRLIRIKRDSANQSEKNSLMGGDLGFDFAAGVFVSFLWDQQEKKEMKEIWTVKDFGMNLQGRFLAGGLLRHGIEKVETTGGWGFGVGLVAKW